MIDLLARPLTREEMAAIRRAVRDEDSVTRHFWAALRRIARNLPFAEDLVAAFYCVKDPATPRKVKLVLLGALGYFILPTDAVADFLPLLGFTDDVAVLGVAMAAVAGAVTDEHRRKARAALAKLQDPA
ncbi:YkvA family protein [Chelatococcus sp. SYSU_G07232]|uniref:YkvA family protein n=1 Tax=Chelatococcus albus TaxID=3047466 RepID=A0ABT7AK57_9HYPH|nr:YkvA family protein [Chelatococcus sp. SYSU_G07232]MDJ1159756.1 YkvA family protein [Chelatococcus sp. SYSU_G07232]